jgi:outer membrane protein assembly factor BamA
VARREAPKIHEIQIAGLKRVNPAMVEQHIQVKPGDPVDPSVINPDLLRVYGDGYYRTSITPCSTRCATATFCA